MQHILRPCNTFYDNVHHMPYAEGRRKIMARVVSLQILDCSVDARFDITSLAHSMEGVPVKVVP